MIDLPSLNAKLQQYAESPRGKQKIDARLAMAREDGKALANGTKIPSEKDMMSMARAFENMVKRRIPNQIAETGDTLHSLPPIQNADGSFSVTLQFSPESLHRDSLENDLGYDGVDNIVALFNCGYHARDYVYGYWSGHKGADGDDAWIRSRKDRDPLYFMQEAVAEFNSKYGKKYNVTVNLGEDYTNF